MQVSCPFCHVTLAIPDSLIGSGQPVQCAQCQQSFAVAPPQAPPVPTVAATYGHAAPGQHPGHHPGYAPNPPAGGYHPLPAQQPIPGSPYDLPVPHVPNRLGLYAGIGGGVVFLAILVVAIWPRTPKPDPMQKLLDVPVSEGIAKTVVLNPSAVNSAVANSQTGSMSPSEGAAQQDDLIPSAAPVIDPLVFPPVEWRGEKDLTLLEAAASRLEAQIAQANQHLAPFRAQRDELAAEVKAATDPEE